MVNRCAVLWYRRDLWVETAHSHVPCFALCRITTPNKQRAAKRYKMAMNWAQVTQKKQQQAQVYVSTIYFYIYAYISTFLSTTLNFSYKVFESFAIIRKTVWKFAVIYAPSLGRLCLYLLVFSRCRCRRRPPCINALTFYCAASTWSTRTQSEFF